MPASSAVGELEQLELDLFVQALKRRHGHDFSQYAPASLTRRVRQLVHDHHCGSISELTTRLLHEPDFVALVIQGLSVPVSEMFRDPRVFRALREQVLPMLASYPQITIWQAGCAHGQEAYSLAILLDEAGLYERSHIFATDFNPDALRLAHEGIYPARDAQLWSRNYQEAGGRRSLADYYSARYNLIKLDQRLRRNITFASHNLVTDKVFLGQVAKDYHREFLRLASTALDRYGPDRRQFNVLAFTVSDKGFAAVKQRIDAFLQEVREIVDRDEDMNQVNLLNIQLFPGARIP